MTGGDTACGEGPFGRIGSDAVDHVEALTSVASGGSFTSNAGMGDVRRAGTTLFSSTFTPNAPRKKKSGV